MNCEKRITLVKDVTKHVLSIITYPQATNTIDQTLRNEKQCKRHTRHIEHYLACCQSFINDAFHCMWPIMFTTNQISRLAQFSVPIAPEIKI